MRTPPPRPGRQGARGLHAQVLDALGRRVVSGELAEGASIDVEAMMAEFGVSRTVVREALRVLGAKGLVGARPKLGTYVEDRGRWLLLDVDVMRWRTTGDPDARLVAELDQVRGIIEPAAAAAAAADCTPERAAALGAAFADLLATWNSGDRQAHVDADVSFHVAILVASGNELLAQFEVVLAPAMRARHSLALAHVTSTAFLDLHRAVLDGIVAQDPVAARTSMQILIERSAADIAAIRSEP